MITIVDDVADGVGYTIYRLAVLRSPDVEDVADGVGYTVYGVGRDHHMSMTS